MTIIKNMYIESRGVLSPHSTTSDIIDFLTSIGVK